MNELIWYSIPGAILLAAVFGVCQFFEVKHEILIASTPVVGFILHQTWRLVYELRGGWAHPKRRALLRLQKSFHKAKSARLTTEEAFFVWELTLYGKDMPVAFQAHDQRAWHYILSFHACAFASLLAFGLSGYRAVMPLYGTDTAHGFGMVASIVCFSIFFLKAWLTKIAIEKQEVALLEQHIDQFATTCKALYPGSTLTTQPECNKA